MEQAIRDHLAIILVVGALPTLVILVVSIVYRLTRSTKIPSIPDHDVLYFERWASGASQRNVLTKLGGASNCLTVTLSKTFLIIKPMPPFNLLFFSEIYDLEHAIHRTDIKSVRANGAASVIVEFESEGISRRVDLILRRREEFLRALDQ